MTELSEQQPELNETLPSRKSHNGFWFSTVILLIVFSIAGVGFYLFQQLREQQQGLNGELNKGDMQLMELTKQITSYQTQLSALTADIAAKDSQFNKTLTNFSQLHTEKLTNTHKELTESLQHIQRQLGKTRGQQLDAVDWKREKRGGFAKGLYWDDYIARTPK